MIELYLFDMDFTLTTADCDITWKEFLIRHGQAAPDTLKLSNKFLADYDNGVLDQDEFNAFQLREFKGKTPAEIARLSQQHFEEFVRSQVRRKAVEFVHSIAAQNLPLGIISSTNVELVKPVANYFGIKNLYCTELAYDASNRATGEISGTYAAGPGKVEVLNKVSAQLGIAPEHTAYFGDSVNDVPILRAVGHPFAVNPSAQLKRIALASNWPILDWNN